MVEEHG
jgi:hypothetical protein